VGLALAYRLATGVPTPPLSVVGLLTGTFNWTRALAPVDDPSITHLWSLSAEEQCYALAALGAVAVAARLRAHAWALAIAATTAARVALWLALADADPYLRADAVYQLSQVDLFLVGAAVASAPEAAARWRWPVTVACAGALGAHALLIEPTTWWELTSLGLPFAGHVNLQPLWSLPLLAVLLAPWVAAAIVRPPWLLRRPALQHLGRRCYALYVLHWAVLTGLDAALGVDHPTELPLALGVAKLAFSLVSLALLAEISWRGLEAPVGRWIRDRLITAG
jgi:peptidoglycan/LPS O-acetylase OafA/YrhL